MEMKFYDFIIYGGLLGNTLFMNYLFYKEFTQGFFHGIEPNMFILYIEIIITALLSFFGLIRYFRLMKND